MPAKLGEHYNESWFAQEKPQGFKSTETAGYQAPPLDGVWATAPYFHNGSVPTLYHVLNSKARPQHLHALVPHRRGGLRQGEGRLEGAGRWTRCRRVEQPHERRKVYDTTQPGRGNGGHTFGDDLTDEERRAVIEYLKTL